MTIDGPSGISGALWMSALSAAIVVIGESCLASGPYT
jgi:hypothetical protein